MKSRLIGIWRRWNSLSWPMRIGIFVGVNMFCALAFIWSQDLWQNIDTATVNEEEFIPAIGVTFVEIKKPYLQGEVEVISKANVFWKMVDTSPGSKLEVLVHFMHGNPTISLYKRFADDIILYQKHYHPHPLKISKGFFYVYISDAYRVEKDKVVFNYHWQRKLSYGATMVLIFGGITALFIGVISGLVCRLALLIGKRIRSEIRMS